MQEHMQTGFGVEVPRFHSQRYGDWKSLLLNQTCLSVHPLTREHYAILISVGETDQCLSGIDGVRKKKKKKKLTFMHRVEEGLERCSSNYLAKDPYIASTTLWYNNQPVEKRKAAIKLSVPTTH